MIWLNGQLLEWIPPLSFAAQYNDQNMVLLYSGMQEAQGGTQSYLFLDPIDMIEGDRWDDLPAFAHDATNPFPDWIGYLGYGLGEKPRGEASIIPLPAFRLTRYRVMFHFDHASETLTVYTRDGGLIPSLTFAPGVPTNVAHIHSNFTRAEYEVSVAATIERIHAGDFYQANITRKFYGEFAATPSPWALFAALSSASPAPYSAYLRHGDEAILSASPECFLQIDADGTISTRPIKGSARRNADAKADAAIQQSLKTSPKNHAENLMIVDLMRNDLARVSAPQSVEVIEQSALYSYATIHHLISTIRAQKRDDATVADVIRACFPPGSMTGAPKIAAINWCATQEKLERGIYSGAIGWIGSAGNCDLSVVIRTLIVKETRFEFQVGGGIVADSTPHEEWLETLAKARGILMALRLTEEDIAAL